MENLYYIGKSNIHGKGVFSNTDLPTGTVVGPACYFYPPIKTVITGMGKFINHSKQPNCRVVQTTQNEWVLVANQNIKDDTELTIDYNNNPWFLKKAEPNYI